MFCGMNCWTVDSLSGYCGLAEVSCRTEKIQSMNNKKKYFVLDTDLRDCRTGGADWSVEVFSFYKKKRNQELEQGNLIIVEKWNNGKLQFK